MPEHDSWHREVCATLPELGQISVWCIPRVELPADMLLMDDHQLLVKELASSQKRAKSTASLSEQHLIQWKRAGYAKIPKALQGTLHGCKACFWNRNASKLIAMFISETEIATCFTVRTILRRKLCPLFPFGLPSGRCFWNVNCSAQFRCSIGW